MRVVLSMYFPLLKGQNNYYKFCMVCGNFKKYILVRILTIVEKVNFYGGFQMNNELEHFKHVLFYFKKCKNAAKSCR